MGTALHSIISRHDGYHLQGYQGHVRGGEDADFVVSTKFQLVDLAGSESDKEPGAEGKLLKEAIAINRGLHTLGKVIRAAAAKQTSIPLRESKLTRLLQDVIGVQPTVSWWRACRLLTAPSSLIETAKTLDFADNGEV
ncbi:hypothetical protein HAZT_HAZT011895 [Hyalella azteca]|uniref:Kinesin motor domain-containing protein n=1 Tax=Hyalella azteca TaxID=294128 RepID=A0A6A0H2L0_HYAAZ|nr:hypothetical protein HAZT_HAZT011895 [Hyalella azteca]